MPATLPIKPWNDPVVDTLGHDPRSRYVETFWLPTLGPTALLLLRHLADRFDRTPDGVELTVADTSHALGLGQRDGTASPIVRTLRRLTQFDLACDDPMSDTVAVRRNVPPVNAPPPAPPAERDSRSRTPSGRRRSSPSTPSPRRRRRSRRVAFTLLEQGDDPDHVERVLHAIGFHPTLCHESAQWAYERHREALDHAAGSRVRDPSLTRSAARASPPMRVRGRAARPRSPGRVARAYDLVDRSRGTTPRLPRGPSGYRASMADDAHLDRLAALLRDARQIVVLTGAGISTESGIPDFRGPQGVWTKDPTAEKHGDAPALRARIPSTAARVAEPRCRQRDVERRAERRAPSRSPSSNAGRTLHTLVTQNVDGLHQRGGHSPEIVDRDPRHRARREVPGVRLARARWTRPSTGCAPARRIRPASSAAAC